LPRWFAVRRSLVLASLVALTACNPVSLQRIAPAADDTLARATVHQLQARDFAPVLARLRETGPEVGTALSRMADSLSLLGRIDSLELVGARINKSPGQRTSDLTYQLHGGSRWMLVEVGLLTERGVTTIAALHTVSLPASLAEVNAFRLTGKSVVHYVTLICAIAAALFSIGSAVLIARTPMAHKWRWVLAALVGIGSFTLNWTTGESGANPFQFQLLSAAIVRGGPYAPWLLSFTCPVGAVLGLYRRQALRRHRSPSSSDGADASSSEVPLPVPGDGAGVAAT
jgi:hypothetical protein